MATYEQSIPAAQRPPVQAYLVALGAVAVAVVLAQLLYPLGGVENVDLVFLAFVVAIAARLGLSPALLASVAGVLAYNFFFIPPVLTFRIADPRNAATLVFFGAFALIASNVAAQVRNQALAARRQAERIEELYTFSQRVSGAVDVAQLARKAVEAIAGLLDREAFLLLPDTQGVLQLQAGSGANPTTEDIDLYTVRTFWNGGSWAERKVMRIGDHLFYPLRAEGRLAGLAALRQESISQSLTDAEDTLFEGVCAQLGVALERLRLAGERDAAMRAVESERLRTSLLSSLSHDLKTPLASITGAITALRQFSSLYDPDAREELLATIEEESTRMTSFVTNLLDMSRIEAGGVHLSLVPSDLNEIVDTALRRMEGMLKGHKLAVALASDLPLLKLDPTLAEQVIVNLLDNAAKYAPTGSTVTVETRARGDIIELRVLDEGPGLPQDDLERVFEKFARAHQGDLRPAGTGLGLAICRGFSGAMGASVQAGNREDAPGAVFTVSFPLALAASRPKDIPA